MPLNVSGGAAGLASNLQRHRGLIAPLKGTMTCGISGMPPWIYRIFTA